MQALMIYLDEKVRPARLFSNVNYGHFTSHRSIENFSTMIHDEVTDDIDTDMAGGGGNGEIAMPVYTYSVFGGPKETLGGGWPQP